jgi:cytochrome c oxidase subunit 2
MQASQKLEAKLAAAVFALLIFFFTLTVVAVKKFGIDLPGCVTNVAAFSKGEVIERAPKHFEIHYVARMWSFEPPNIELPTGAEADIYLNSVDVNHGFQILGTNVNLMAVPGAVNYSHVVFKTPGKYTVVCHEYCGAGHHGMTTTIMVSDNPTRPGEAITRSVQPVLLSADAEAGSKIVVTKGCTGCHSLDPTQTSVAPTFKGLWGKSEVLTDGSKVTVDEAYVTESIKQPQAKVVKGFQPIMPALAISDAELKQVIEFLKTMK